MNAEWIITVFALIDEVMKALGHQSHPLAQVSDAEVLTVAVVAAKFCQNHHERTLLLMQQLGYLLHPLSVSRFNRRLHQLGDWLTLLVEWLGEVFQQGETFIVDSMPIPVCRRARARRCKKVQGRAFYGYCAAKQERFFGWRLHLICTPEGVPVSYTLLPGSCHDLTPVHELSAQLKRGAQVLGDKGYNSQADESSILTETGVHLLPIPKAKKDSLLNPRTWQERLALRTHRRRIESLNSQLESFGAARLRCRTQPGLELKLVASLLAVTFTNAY